MATVKGNVTLPGGSTMDRSFKPQGYSSVSPYVVANGAQDVIDFLIESFDARQTRRYDMPDGSMWMPHTSGPSTPVVSPSMSRNKGKAIPNAAPG
jgi:hypothetical protein